MPRCKWAKECTDYVPVPFGHGNCAMVTLECVYDGDMTLEFPDDCPEDDTCPGFEPDTEVTDA